MLKAHIIKHVYIHPVCLCTACVHPSAFCPWDLRWPKMCRCVCTTSWRAWRTSAAEPRMRTSCSGRKSSRWRSPNRRCKTSLRGPKRWEDEHGDAFWCWAVKGRGRNICSQAHTVRLSFICIDARMFRYTNKCNRIENICEVVNDGCFCWRALTVRCGRQWLWPLWWMWL